MDSAFTEVLAARQRAQVRIEVASSVVVINR